MLRGWAPPMTIRWRPRLRAQRTRSTPRAQPSGAASQLDLFAQPAVVNVVRCASGEEAERHGSFEAGEDRGGGDAEVTGGDFGEQGAEIGRDREVAALEEAVVVEPRPLSVDAAAAHAAAQDE